NWLGHCVASHSQCARVVCAGQPTRLLHIDTLTEPSIVRLIDVQMEKPLPEYVALSHRWGESRTQFKSLESNVIGFKHAILVANLPKTFRDAIAVTVAVGLQHLWIDSLCIIQDSKRDWETESAKMGVIYENAVLTIAASTATDSSFGCFANLQQPVMQRLSLPSIQAENKHRKTIGVLRSAVADPFAVPSSSLNYRGWVLQETVLSRRILHFTNHQVYWQCRCVAESEDGTVLHSIDSPYCSPDAHLKNNRTLFLPNSILEKDLARVWWTWAADYSRREFTEPADRLYACAGISQYFQRLSNRHPLTLGLLRTHLPGDLLW
ncbi:HET-domain-containing protein, partial [Polyplosphaeria fusca]